MQTSSKVPKYKRQPKYQNMTVFSWFSENFRNLVRTSKDFCIFSHFDAFSPIYSGRSRKMQKNGEIRAKIGVDTADILIFWIEKRIFILWWYFDTLALCKIKVKMQDVLLENLQPVLGCYAAYKDAARVRFANWQGRHVLKLSRFKAQVHRTPEIAQKFRAAQKSNLHVRWFEICMTILNCL